MMGKYKNDIFIIFALQKFIHLFIYFELFKTKCSHTVDFEKDPQPSKELMKN